MYIEKLFIKNFRSIKEIEIEFNKDVNVLIGENNAGKSAIIDTIRICLSIGKQWRDIGIKNDEDFYIDSSIISDMLEPIEFDLFFKIENEADAEYFNSMIYQDEQNPLYQDIQIHFRYFIEINSKGNSVLRWKIWGGDKEGQLIKPEEAQLLYYTYLAPLRDAEQELKPYSKNNKVTSLFKEITSYETNENEQKNIKLDFNKKNELSNKLESVINDKDWSGLIKTGEKSINKHLEKSSVLKNLSKIDLSFLEYKYENIIKGVITRKPIYNNELIGENTFKQKYFDISQNGLGENNLILAATVLGDIENRRIEKIEHYYALLIEEPESHLHPQKQNTFFNYLNSLQNIGTQIFITSHSPTITSKSDLDNLIVLSKSNNNVKSFAVKNSELSKKNKAYLRKFLDVTKSQLFFSNGVVLVEGISEALLLPNFAKILGKKYELDKNGIEVVNINGVAFEPFAKLFNSTDKNKRLSIPCSIITDNDKGKISPKNFVNNQVNHEKAKRILYYLKELNYVDASNRIIKKIDDDIDLNEFENEEILIREVIEQRINLISDRAINTFKLRGENLEVFLSNYTFEFELMVEDDFNCWLIRIIYMKMHPKTNFVPNEETNEIKAFDLLNKLDSNKDKSELAENIAYFLESSEIIRNKFRVPNYIVKALNWAIFEINV